MDGGGDGVQLHIQVNGTVRTIGNTSHVFKQWLRFRVMAVQLLPSGSIRFKSLDPLMYALPLLQVHIFEKTFLSLFKLALVPVIKRWLVPSKFHTINMWKYETQHLQLTAGLWITVYPEQLWIKN